MFQSDSLVYIQFEKTGCSHIGKLLSKLFNGEFSEVHHIPAIDEQLRSSRYFISSIRNPWDWYLSLWTYGVQGKGTITNRLTERRYRLSKKSILIHPIKNLIEFYYERKKDVKMWHSLYDRGDNVESFRKWLRLIHEPNNSRYIDEDYGRTAIYSFCGFMTYRYFYLCCSDTEKLKSSKLISNFTDLARFDNENCYINFFVRQEALEETLIQAIENVRLLTQEEKEIILTAEKTNVSQRNLLITDYYDGESIDLIQNRDRFLIEKFNYTPPNKLK